MSLHVIVTGAGVFNIVTINNNSTVRNVGYRSVMTLSFQEFPLYGNRVRPHGRSAPKLKDSHKFTQSMLQIIKVR